MHLVDRGRGLAARAWLAPAQPTLRAAEHRALVRRTRMVLAPWTHAKAPPRLWSHHLHAAERGRTRRLAADPHPASFPLAPEHMPHMDRTLQGLPCQVRHCKLPANPALARSVPSRRQAAGQSAQMDLDAPHQERQSLLSASMPPGVANVRDAHCAGCNIGVSLNPGISRNKVVLAFKLQPVSRKINKRDRIWP
jgi:hypothetical protein